MNHSPLHPPLPASLDALVRVDGAWLRCRQCPDAFWGVANVYAVVLAKAQKHADKAHGANFGFARPARRNAAAVVKVDVSAEVNALVTLLLGNELGHGVARKGFALASERYIVKQARSQDRREDNLVEWQAWNSAPDWARPFLCPMAWCSPDGQFVIARKADRIGQVSWELRKQVQDALPFVNDLHEYNIGIVDGRPVATDYSGGWKAREIVWPSQAPACLRPAPAPAALTLPHATLCASGWNVIRHQGGGVDDCGCPTCRSRIVRSEHP